MRSTDKSPPIASGHRAHQERVLGLENQQSRARVGTVA